MAQREIYKLFGNSYINNLKQHVSKTQFLELRYHIIDTNNSKKNKIVILFKSGLRLTVTSYRFYWTIYSCVEKRITGAL